MNDTDNADNIPSLEEPFRTSSKKNNKNKNHINPRSASRLVAIQALYAMDITHKRPSEVIDDFNQFCESISESDSQTNAEIIIPVNFDKDYTASILYGVVREQRAIDPLISDFLPDKWQFNRLDKVICSILRAAIYELLFSPAIPPKVTINEYINIASSFQLNDGNTLINGILNAIARNNNLIEGS